MCPQHDLPGGMAETIEGCVCHVQLHVSAAEASLPDSTCRALSPASKPCSESSRRARGAAFPSRCVHAPALGQVAAVKAGLLFTPQQLEEAT